MSASLSRVRAPTASQITAAAVCQAPAVKAFGGAVVTTTPTGHRWSHPVTPPGGYRDLVDGA